MMNSEIQKVLFVLCIFQGCSSILNCQAFCADSIWPNIRGPELNGHANGNKIVDRFPEDGPPVLWTRELGQGYSSFIAWDQCVATQFQNLGGQYVVCLNADSGATKWQFRYDWPYDPAGVYPGPRSTPTFDQGRVFFTSPSGLIGCLSADSGALLWSLDLAKAFEVSMPGFGYSCSPIVVDDMIVLPVGSHDTSFVALNKSNGSVRWKSTGIKSDGSPRNLNQRESKASYCPVYPIEFLGRQCIVGYLQNALICCDAENGELLWRHSLSSGYDEHAAWPIYEEPFLWLTGAFQRGSELLELTNEKNPAVKTVRQSKLMSNDIFSSVLYDGALFGFDLHEAQAKTHRTSRGIFRCIDFRTGEALWSIGNGRVQRNATGPSDDIGTVVSNEQQGLVVGHSTVLVADGKLIVMNDMGELILIKASRESYEELGRTSLLGGEICWTQPAIANSRLFVRNQSRAVCVYLGSPEALSSELKDRSLTVSQVPQSRFQDLASVLLGIEPEYLFDLPSLAWLWRWYWISLVGVIAVPFALVQLIYAMDRFAFLRRARNTSLASSHQQPRLIHCSYWVIVFVLGALGTTFLSRWTGGFVFTWHVCLYVAWHFTVLNLSKRSDDRTILSRVLSASAALFLLSSCLVYFLLCRRLSLVFEWVFLAGFLAALPFNLAGKRWHLQRRLEAIWQFVLICLGFSAYYWASAAILLLKSQ